MNPNFKVNRNTLIGTALLTMTQFYAQTFSDFEYKGKDKIYTENPLKSDEFYSPILQGCYPDPSITRKGNDYYLVNSSFAMFPGVPIFHSTDLVNWKQIGHVLDRPSQLKVENAGFSDGIYAPDIKYNKYNDTFYMITTQFASGIGNMVVKTKDPKKGWSEVQKLNFEGIDHRFSLMTTEKPTSFITTHHQKEPNYIMPIVSLKSWITIWRKIRLSQGQIKLS